MIQIQKFYNIITLDTIIEIIKIVLIYITLLIIFYLIHNNNKRLLIISILCIVSVLLFHIDLKKHYLF